MVAAVWPWIDWHLVGFDRGHFVGIGQGVGGLWLRGALCCDSCDRAQANAELEPKVELIIGSLILGILLFVCCFRQFLKVL